MAAPVRRTAGGGEGGYRTPGSHWAASASGSARARRHRAASPGHHRKSAAAVAAALPKESNRPGPFNQFGKGKGLSQVQISA